MELEMVVLTAMRSVAATVDEMVSCLADWMAGSMAQYSAARSVDG